MKTFQRIVKYLRNPRLTYQRTITAKRKLHYQLLSDLKNVSGKPIVNQPLLLKGTGYVSFGQKVRFGVELANDFYSSYCYLNVRNTESKIIFGNDISINNSFSAVSEGEGIIINDNTIIGTHVSIMDTDFHHSDPEKRMESGYEIKQVIIGKNVWIGNNVSILKGVKIGNNSIIANGAVVACNIPENVIAGGIPARTIKSLND